MAKKEARTRRIAPPPAHAAARCAAGHPEYADSRKKDLFPQVLGNGRSATEGQTGNGHCGHRAIASSFDRPPTLPRDLHPHRSPLTLDDDLTCCRVGTGEPIDILAHTTVAWVAWLSWWAVTAMGE